MCVKNLFVEKFRNLIRALSSFVLVQMTVCFCLRNCSSFYRFFFLPRTTIKNIFDDEFKRVIVALYQN